MSLKRLVAGIAIAQIALSAATPVFAAAERSGSDQQSKTEAKQRLKQVEKEREEMARRLAEARAKEQAAFRQLHQIKKQLNQTADSLNSSKHTLQRTESTIQETENKITQTKSREEIMSDEAGRRLRQIYEGQRLGLLEMMFQVTSLQNLLDLFYYQERIAVADRELLEDLRQKARDLLAKKGQLGAKKNHLGDLVSEFARKAMQLNQQKDTQEQTAEKLRKQRAFYEQAERQLAAESQALEHQIVDMVKGNKSGRPMTQGSGTMSMPLKAAITSPFGPRRHPIFGVRKFHTGIDLAGPNHSPIRAADSGTVLFTGQYGGYGRVVIISHGKGMATLYAHLSKYKVSEGDNVQKGDIIAYEGSTGFSTGPHLHFEVRVDGKPKNPLSFVH